MEIESTLSAAELDLADAADVRDETAALGRP